MKSPAEENALNGYEEVKKVLLTAKFMGTDFNDSTFDDARKLLIMYRIKRYRRSSESRRVGRKYPVLMKLLRV